MTGGLEFLIILAVLGGTVVFVTAPLRRLGEARAEGEPAPATLADLEAARESKYRELRDAELDHSTGKLSDEDYAALAGSLRAEAIEILRSIDRALPSAQP